MYNIIFLSLFVVGAGLIGLIVIRKFPVLARVDINTIKKEKEDDFKEQILKKRFKRAIKKNSAKILEFLEPVTKIISNWVRDGYEKLHELRAEYKKKSEHQEELSDHKREELVATLLSASEELIKKEAYKQAEEKLIEVISLDNKNTTAFKNLGRVYVKLGSLEEARETFEYLVKVRKEEFNAYKKSLVGTDKTNEEVFKIFNAESQFSQAYFDLANVYQELEKYPEAIKNLKKALEIEPNNPRYLDTIMEISIIIKDKITALDAYKKLKEANPDNQKLAEFKDAIDAL